jgi:hypothetical protein
MNPAAAWAFRKSPAARLWSTGAMLSRQGEPTPIKAAHIITGFKPRIINPEFQKERALKQRAGQLLDVKFGRGEVRKFERFYVPKGQQKDEEVELLLKAQ